MKTPWTDKVDRLCPLPEYPRPQMVREPWLNLNGPWDYAFGYTEARPARFEGQILVPFSPETALSGVNRALRAQEYLWYHRTVQLPESFRGRRVLLHFGAVDQQALVWVNGKLVLGHDGGYLPFEADISAFIDADELDILVRVSDETDAGERSRGKQKTKRGGIWYTPQSGIWQTVWLEAVPESYIRSLHITPDFDRGEVAVSADIVGGERAYAHFRGADYALPAVIPVEDVEAWTPEHPKLYDFSVRCGEDEVRSYFAMRCFTVERDEKGVKRLFLNHKPYFHNGLLDQGYWPDGLYTAPTDEAMVFDIQTMKAMGFNMLRKHIKVEPLRWYYHCDRLGMLVWQDMPNGGGDYNLAVITAPLVTGISLKDSHYRLFAREDAARRAAWRTELGDMIRHLYNCPCICM